MSTKQTRSRPAPRPDHFGHPPGSALFSSPLSLLIGLLSTLLLLYFTAWDLIRNDLNSKYGYNLKYHFWEHLNDISVDDIKNFDLNGLMDNIKGINVGEFIVWAKKVLFDDFITRGQGIGKDVRRWLDMFMNQAGKKEL